MKQSIWRASTKNVEHYRKYDSRTIVEDVTNEFKGYSTFNGIHKGIIVGRIMNAIRQSLRVRGVNVLFRLRRSLVNYEKQLTNEIRLLEKQILTDKVAMQVNSISIEKVINHKEYSDHVKSREQYLITKVKLECKILERKRLRQQLKTSADDILRESK